MKNSAEDSVLQKAFAREYTVEAILWRARLRKNFSFVSKKRLVNCARDSAYLLFGVMVGRPHIDRHILAVRGDPFGSDIGLNWNSERDGPAPEAAGCGLWCSRGGDAFVDALRGLGYPNAQCRASLDADPWGCWGSVIDVGEQLWPDQARALVARLVRELVIACDVTPLDNAMLERARIAEGMPQHSSVRTEQRSKSVRL